MLRPKEQDDLSFKRNAHMQVRLKMEFEAERQVAYWSNPEEGSYWLRPRWIAVKMVKCI